MDYGSLLKYGNSMFKGLLADMAPGLLKGAMNEILVNITVAEACAWVESNYCLWDTVGDAHRNQLKNLKLNDTAWLTADWCINAVKDKKPQLASLFLGWKKAHNWLERQCDILKAELALTPTAR